MLSKVEEHLKRYQEQLANSQQQIILLQGAIQGLENLIAELKDVEEPKQLTEVSNRVGKEL